MLTIPSHASNTETTKNYATVFLQTERAESLLQCYFDAQSQPILEKWNRFQCTCWRSGRE